MRPIEMKQTLLQLKPFEKNIYNHPDDVTQGLEVLDIGLAFNSQDPGDNFRNPVQNSQACSLRYDYITFKFQNWLKTWFVKVNPKESNFRNFPYRTNTFF